MGRVKRFVQLYQDLTPLTMGELWALPVMLRLALVEFLAQAVSRITLAPNAALPALTLPDTSRTTRRSPTASPACGFWQPRIGRSFLKASAAWNTSCVTIRRTSMPRWIGKRATAIAR